MPNNLPLPLAGIAPDMPSWEQGEAWGDCTNMRFRRAGVSERVRGDDDTGVALGSSTGLLQNIYLISENYWLASSLDSVLSWDGAGAIADDVTPISWGTLTEPGQITGTRSAFLQYLIVNTIERAEPYVFDSATQGLSPMESYPVASGFAAPNCTCLRSLFNTFLFCLDTDDQTGTPGWDATPQTVVWSSNTTGTLPTFEALPGNRAGSTTLATSTPLVDVIQLRESAILFSSTDIFRIEFIGGQEVFDFTRIFSGDGLLARNCVTEYEGIVYYISTSGQLMATDGTNVKTIGDDRVNLTILGDLNDDPRASWVAANPTAREIMFAPLSRNEAAPTVAYLFDVDSGNIGKRALPDGGGTAAAAGVNSATADDSWDAIKPTDTWNDGADIPWNFRESTPGNPVMFVASLADELYRLDVNADLRTGALTRTGITPDPASDAVVTCRRVWLDSTITDGTLTVGARYDDSSPYESQTVAIDAATRHVPLIAKGRQFKLELNSTTTAPWIVSRIQMEFGDSGARFSEPGKAFSRDQLDREFRNVQQGINNLLSGDITVTGQWTFDVGRSLPDGGGPNNPLRFEGYFEQFQPAPEELQIISVGIDFSGLIQLEGSLATFRFVELSPGVESPALVLGDSTPEVGNPLPLVLDSNQSAGVAFVADLVFLSSLSGIRFFDQTKVGGAVVWPSQPSNAVVRYDLYTLADADNPPGVANDAIATMMWHGEQTGLDEFSFQLLMGTAENYVLGSYEKSDPRIRVRSGKPEGGPTGDGDWNGDWGAIPVVFNLEEFTDDPAWQGGLLMFDLDASYPDGGRTIPFKQQSAALYIDYADTIKPGPFAPGATITFGGGFGYNTPDAAFSVALGTLTIPAGNPGAYTLNAAFTLDVGTAATGIIGAHSDGAPIQGLAVAATTSNNPTNTTITVSITGIFPVDDTAHTIDIRVMPTSAIVNVVDAGQFWIKREFS